MLSIVVHLPVAGSHISAAYTGEFWLSNPKPPLPPEASTLPSGRSVMLNWRRAIDIDDVDCHVGVPAFRSRISAVLVAAKLVSLPSPPAIRTLPSKIAEDP